MALNVERIHTFLGSTQHEITPTFADFHVFRPEHASVHASESCFEPQKFSSDGKPFSRSSSIKNDLAREIEVDNLQFGAGHCIKIQLSWENAEGIVENNFQGCSKRPCAFAIKVICRLSI